MAPPLLFPQPLQTANTNEPRGQCCPVIFLTSSPVLCLWGRRELASQGRCFTRVLQNPYNREAKQREKNKNDEANRVAARAEIVNRKSHHWRDDKATESSQTTHPAGGSSDRLRNFLRNQLKDGGVAHTHSDGQKNFSGERKFQLGSTGHDHGSVRHDQEGENGGIFAAFAEAIR